MSGKLAILDEQCATCIFRPGNPMRLRRGRMQDLMADCRRTQAYIPCHETLTYQDDEETVATADSPVCRGFYDRYPGLSQLVRIMERINGIEFVTLAQALTNRTNVLSFRHGKRQNQARSQRGQERRRGLDASR